MNGAKRTGADEAVWKAMKCRVDAESARSQRPNKRVARDRRPIAGRPTLKSPARAAARERRR